MSIGFIGVGNIGRPMAQQLLNAGHALVVHDIRRDVAAPLLDGGATWAESVADVAGRCDVVHACLPGPPEMEAVTLGDGGLVTALPAGALYIDHTTNAPALAARVHAAFAERGIAMVDAPVSGGKEGAEIRDLLVMAGGDDAAFARARPYLDAIAERVMHTGAVGSGCICKILHNAAAFTVDEIMTEMWTTGVKAGVAPEVLIEVFTKGALGHMSNLKVRLRETFLRGDFDARFALKLAHKDLGLATSLAREQDVPVRLVDLCQQEIVAAMDRGWADRDTSIFLTLQEERAGAKVRLPEDS